MSLLSADLVQYSIKEDDDVPELSINDTELATLMAINNSASGGQPSGGGGINIDIVAYCYILPAVCLLGIIGNVANLITLASPRLRAMSYMYLRALSCADLCCMFSVLIFVSTQIAAANDVPTNQYWIVFYKAHGMLPLINFSISAGVLTVVVLTVERYISICFPIYFRNWNSPGRATFMTFVAYIIPFILYVPYAIWRHEIVQIDNDSSNGYKPDDGRFHKTVGWQIYKWIREGLLRFLPIVALAILNMQIIIAFKRRQLLRQRLNKRPMSQSQTTPSQRDEAILFLLAAIVVLFFICNIPAAINLLFIDETMKKNPYYKVFRAMANLLEITNHAINFYVFCMCSSDYRITFLETFPCLRRLYKQMKRARSFVRVRVLGGEPRNLGQMEDDGISEMTGMKTIHRTEPVLRPPIVRLANDDTIQVSTEEIVVEKSYLPIMAAENESLLPQEEPGCYKGPVTISDLNGEIRFITDDEDDDTLL